MQEARSVYVDASWCENNSGVLQYPIPDGIEVSGNDLVAYCDDFSVAGVVSSINPSANRLYLLERSPKGFFFASPAGDKVWAREQMSDIGEELTFFTMPLDADAVFGDFTLYANLPSTQQNREGGTIVCKPDDTTATLVGNLFHEVLNLQSPPKSHAPS